MQSAPIVIVTPPPRECVVVDGHRYCQDEPVAPREVAYVIIALVVFLAWAALPPILSDRGVEFPAWCYWAWYAGPVALLVLGLLMVPQ